MKKFYLAIGGILTVLGAGGIHNELDVEIMAGQKVITFETKSECRETKSEIIKLFAGKNLKPEEAFMVKAFADQSCGSLFEASVPKDIADMTVTNTNVYYTKDQYSKRKNELFSKTKKSPNEITIFELRELTGIMNIEIKERGGLTVDKISPGGVISALED